MNAWPPSRSRSGGSINASPPSSAQCSPRPRPADSATRLRRERRRHGTALPVDNVHLHAPACASRVDRPQGGNVDGVILFDPDGRQDGAEPDSELVRRWQSGDDHIVV